MNCPHCGSDCTSEPCAGRIAEVSYELRRIGRDLSRCAHPCERAMLESPHMWCPDCGSFRLASQPGVWAIPRSVDRAKSVDEMVKTWGYDLGDNPGDSDEEIVN